MPTAPDGSISQHRSPRPDLLAFEIRDKITKPDIEWMSSIADQAMQSHGKIDMLIIISNYEGSEAGAMFDSYATSVMTRSIAHIRPLLCGRRTSGREGYDQSFRSGDAGPDQNLRS